MLWWMRSSPFTSIWLPARPMCAPRWPLCPFQTKWLMSLSTIALLVTRLGAGSPWSSWARSMKDTKVCVSLAVTRSGCRPFSVCRRFRCLTCCVWISPSASCSDKWHQRVHCGDPEADVGGGAGHGHCRRGRCTFDKRRRCSRVCTVPPAAGGLLEGGLSGCGAARRVRGGAGVAGRLLVVVDPGFDVVDRDAVLLGALRVPRAGGSGGGA